MPAVTKVDDQYWLDEAKTIVDAAQAKPEEAATRLQTFIGWLWGIYTAATAVGFALSTKHLTFEATMLIAAGSVALIVVYFLCVWVGMPIYAEFDPRSPTEIANAYTHSLQEKRDRLQVTIAMAVVASGIVSFALLVASAPQPAPIAVGSFDGVLSSQDGRTRLELVAHVQGDREVLVKTVAIPGNQVAENRYRSAADGLLQPPSLDVAEGTTSVKVSMAYQVDDRLRTELSRTVKLTPQPVDQAGVPAASNK